MQSIRAGGQFSVGGTGESRSSATMRLVETGGNGARSTGSVDGGLDGGLDGAKRG